MSLIVVKPHQDGEHWGWWWNGQSPSGWFEKKKDAVAAAKGAAKQNIKRQKEKHRRVEPVMIEKHYRGSSPPRTITIGEDDIL